jgi:hypothetical protein
MPSRTGAQRWPIVSAVPLSVREVPRRHSRLSPPKHKGSTSSGPTNSATLTTMATTASLPGLRSTQATSRPLNNRIRLAILQRREHASAAPGTNRPSCRVAVLMLRSLPAYCQYPQTIPPPLLVQGRLCVACFVLIRLNTYSHVLPDVQDSAAEGVLRLGRVGNM